MRRKHSALVKWQRIYGYFVGGKKKKKDCLISDQLKKIQKLFSVVQSSIQQSV